MQPQKLVGQGSQVQVDAAEAFKACLFLGSLDGRCDKLINDLHRDNNFLNGDANYPPRQLPGLLVSLSEEETSVYSAKMMV